jgi:hypothetical protein
MNDPASTSLTSCVPQRCSIAPLDSVPDRAKLFVNRRAFVRHVRRHWIILDVHSDQYYCIPERDFAFMGPYIHGWSSVAPGIPPAEGFGIETQSLLAQLVGKGVLTERFASGRELSPSPLAVPATTLSTGDVPPGRGFRPLLVSTFWLACATADRRLRKQTFESIVMAVEARRIERSGRRTSGGSQTLRHLVATFNRLRLWYPRAYLCLFDSLALLEFLAWHDIYPRWTFGVTADPFLAHCWLQDGPVLLNDALSRVAGYTPIMSV